MSPNDWGALPKLGWEAKLKLADALLACASMSTLASRDVVLAQLPEEVTHRLSAAPTAQMQVVNLLEVCLSYDAMDQLLDVVHGFEGNSQERRNLDRIVAAVAPPPAQDAIAQLPNPGDNKPASSIVSAATKPKKPRPLKATDGPDVYISYHEADETWVSETLLPQLEAAGLSVMIDYRDFAIGVPRLVNIERAVERSRHTLIVMTPDWVENDWNAFQGLLASSEDPSGLRQKLLPLKLRPCTPPTHIAMLEILDLTNQARREAQIERLVLSLAQERDR